MDRWKEKAQVGLNSIYVLGHLCVLIVSSGQPEARGAIFVDRLAQINFLKAIKYTQEEFH